MTDNAVVTTGGTDLRALTLRGAIGETVVIVKFNLRFSPETRREAGGEKALSKGYGIGSNGDQSGVIRKPGVNRFGKAKGGCLLVGDPPSSVAESTEEGKPLTTFKV